MQTCPYLYTFICKFSPTPAVCYCKRFYCTGLCLVSHHRSNNPWTLQCWAVLRSYVPIVSHQPLEYPGEVCSPCLTCTLCQMWCVGTNPHVTLLQTYHYCSVVQASHVVQEKIVNTTVLSPGMQRRQAFLAAVASPGGMVGKWSICVCLRSIERFYGWDMSLSLEMLSLLMLSIGSNLSFTRHSPRLVVGHCDISC